MYNNPRRPFYNYRTEDMPTDSGTQHVAVIDSKRFWKLLKKLTHRQQEAVAAQAEESEKVAAAR